MIGVLIPVEERKKIRLTQDSCVANPNFVEGKHDISYVAFSIRDWVDSGLQLRKTIIPSPLDTYNSSSFLQLLQQFPINLALLILIHFQEVN